MVNKSSLHIIFLVTKGSTTVITFSFPTLFLHRFVTRRRQRSLHIHVLSWKFTVTICLRLGKAFSHRVVSSQVALGSLSRTSENGWPVNRVENNTDLSSNQLYTVDRVCLHLHGPVNRVVSVCKGLQFVLLSETVQTDCSQMNTYKTQPLKPHSNNT